MTKKLIEFLESLTHSLGRLLESTNHLSSPYCPISHECCYFPSAGGTGVPLDGIEVCRLRSSLALVTVRGFPKYQPLSAEFWVAEAVTSELESGGCNIVTDKWEITIKFFVGDVILPINILSFTQHPGVSAI